MSFKKKRILVFFISICLMTINITSPMMKISAVENEKIIVNGGFENDMKPWWFWKTDDNFKTIIDKSDHYEGISSIKLYNESSKSTRGAVYQFCDVSNYLSKQIKILESIKSKNFLGSCIVRVKFYDESKNTQIGDAVVKSVYVEKDMDWKHKSYNVDIPNDKKIKYMQLEYIYSGTGELWIDNSNIECPNRESTSNLINNPGFEEDLNNWSSWISSGNMQTSIDDKTSKDGRQSLKISSNGISRGSVSQSISIPENLRGGYVKVAQFFKTENLSGISVNMRVRYLESIESGAKEVCKSNYYLLGVSKNSDWKNNQFDVYIPQEVQAIAIDYIYNECQGSVWIDNVNVEKESVKYDRNILKNGGFESTISDVPQEWQEWYADNNLSYAYDYNEKFEGDASLKMSSSASGKSARITTIVPYSSDIAGKTVKLTQMLKSNQNNNITIHINYVDENWNPVNLEYKQSFNLSSENKWNKYSLDTIVPNNDKIKNIKIDYRVDNLNAAVWIDDVKLSAYVNANYFNVNPSIIELKSGEKISPNVEFDPLNATYKDIIMTSENEDIAKINDKSIVAVSKGITKVTLEQKNCGLKVTVPVLVNCDDTINIDKVNNLELVQGSSIDSKINLNGDYNDLLYSMFCEAQKGYVKVNDNGTFTYYSDNEYSGNDTFSILVKDSKGNQSVAQYNVSIKKNSDKKVTSNFIINTNENSNAEGSIEDDYNEGTTFTISTSTNNGKFSIDKYGKYNYIPNKNFYGYDDICIHVKKSNGDEKTINGRIFVSPDVNILKGKLKDIHPRTITNKGEIDNLKKLINSDSTVKLWFDKFQKEVDGLIDKPVVKYNNSGSLLDTGSKDYIEKLSFMYAITSNNKYAERAWKEIENVCNYKDWNADGEFLDAAQLSSAVAIGYDLIYSYLNSNQRDIVKKSIEDKLLKKADNFYNNNSNFTTWTHNWNIVCNSAILLSSSVIADYNDNELALKSIQNALKSVQYFLNSYYKDGSSYEGPTYWQLSTTHMIRAVECLKNSLDMEKIFDDKIDYEKLAEYPINILGSTASFNYADADDGAIPSYYNEWFAKKTGDLKLAEYSMRWYRNKYDVSIYDLLWYNPEILKIEDSAELDRYFDSTQLVTMRSSYEKNATFIGFKGGKTAVNHGDLDIGSFVFDSLGVRWAEDLGAENYGVNGYWDKDAGGKRWCYYKKRAEGHNTLEIGSSKNEDQVINSDSEIVESNINCEEPYAVLDMTPAYSDKALSVKRKVQLSKERKDLTVEDSFVLKEKQDVAWQMHTRADVKISDNGKSIILKEDGKTLKMLVSSSCDITTEVKPVNVSSLNGVDNSNLKKIEMKTNSKIGVIKVKLVPMDEIEDEKVTIKNGDFKNNLNNWWLTWNKLGNFKAELDKEGCNDENSMKLSSSDGSYASGIVNQSVSIATFKGALFKLNQYIKKENFKGILKLKYTFKDKDGKDIDMGQFKTLVESGTEDWQLVEAALNVPQGADTVLIEYLYENSIGTVWVDDVKQVYDLGDVNQDGNIDTSDLALEASKYNKVDGVDGTYTRYDMNGDHIVDIYDICKVSSLIEE